MVADVSCDGGGVIWGQMCHAMEVWSYGGRCVISRHGHQCGRLNIRYRCNKLFLVKILSKSNK